MNIHDKTHDLANALRNSAEYREFLAVKRQVDSDEAAKKMIKDFLTKQMEFEMARMSGKPEDKNETAQLQKMVELISCNSRARDFLQAHMKFQRTMADVYKIIGEAVAEGMDFFEKK